MGEAGAELIGAEATGLVGSDATGLAGAELTGADVTGDAPVEAGGLDTGAAEAGGLETGTGGGALGRNDPRLAWAMTGRSSVLVEPALANSRVTGTSSPARSSAANGSSANVSRTLPGPVVVAAGTVSLPEGTALGGGAAAPPTVGQRDDRVAELQVRPDVERDGLQVGGCVPCWRPEAGRTRSQRQTADHGDRRPTTSTAARHVRFPSPPVRPVTAVA
jgi:hypothetical protein